MKTRFLALFIFSAFLFMNSCTKDDEIAVSPEATATPATQTITSGTATSHRFMYPLPFNRRFKSQMGQLCNNKKQY